MTDEIEQPENEGTEVPKEETEAPAEKPATRRGRPPKAEGQEKPVPALRRIVLYTTGDLTIRPAIITRVNEGSGTVDLSVFNSEGCVAARVVHEGDADTPGTYFWE